MKLLLLLLLSAFIFYSIAIEFEPFDVIEDSIVKYKNNSVDSCDNFYRHACSFNSPENLFGAAFQDMLAYLEHVQKNAYWNNLDVIKLLPIIKEKEMLLSSKEDMIRFFTGVFSKVCEKNDEQAEDLYKLMVEVMGSNYSQDDENTRNKGKSTWETCDSRTDSLREALTESSRHTPMDLLSQFEACATEHVNLAKSISSHLDVDVRQGIEETKKLVEQVLGIAENLIKSTPWVKNRHLVAKFEKITSELRMHDNYGKDFQKVTNILVAVEKTFLECRLSYSFVEESDLLCYIMTASEHRLSHGDEVFSLDDNAFNNHPTLAFGFPNYHHTQYGREMASKLGYTGFTVGHEIGHTFFDSYNQPELLPYFSKQVDDCVQNQFNATCTEYMEDSCATTDDFLDENGADIFGLQLAYELMKEYYGFDIGNFIERLNMTYDQLFFYSYATGFCSGSLSSVELQDDGKYEPHSANNIRINTIAQHPAFQQAFNCPADSRMMQSATKQCHIYGNEAPETRRKFLI